MRIGPPILAVGLVCAGLFTLFVPTWNLPTKGTQTGPNGPSLVQYAPTGSPLFQTRNGPPPANPPLIEDTRPATEAYKNVTVLTDLNAGQFMQLQQAITNWVAPQQGCDFCHAGADFASDAKPTKAAARDMIKMVRHLNADWTEHVGAAGVTCWSCHRGQPVPAEIWFSRPPHPQGAHMDKPENWNESGDSVRQFFPNAGYELYLLQDTPGLAQSYTALPNGQVADQVVVKRLYEVMMQMSAGMGVNCTYCHNSRAFYDWGQSLPARWTGYSGIQMVRDINRNVLLPLAVRMPQTRETADDPHTIVLPDRMRGPQEGNGFVLCGTCHYGLPKPADHAQELLTVFPGLKGPGREHAASAADQGGQP
ncbi:photosynthetic reaction center cytochrome PufC [Methylobacterium sp. SD21]|uniref:photosynthetic reaction center cytochrome PufC n=1 Tax=Methylobacterium litchii TaxID=3138810 RepID=UPI00313D7636